MFPPCFLSIHELPRCTTPCSKPLQFHDMTNHLFFLNWSLSSFFWCLLVLALEKVLKSHPLICAAGIIWSYVTSVLTFPARGVLQFGGIVYLQSRSAEGADGLSPSSSSSLFLFQLLILSLSIKQYPLFLPAACLDVPVNSQLRQRTRKEKIRTLDNI